MAPRGFTLALVVTMAAMLAGDPASARRKPPSKCTGGQFVFNDAPLTVGDETTGRVGHALLLADGAVSVPGVCPPTPARLKPGRRGTRITARWTGCDGIPGKVRLRARTNADCSEVVAHFRLPKTGFATKPKGGYNVKGVADACFLDGGIQPFEDGQPAYVIQQCTSSTDDLVKILDEICQTLQGEPCASVTTTCARRAEEIFTGVSLFPSSVQPPSWNHFGGRGEIMAQAGLCILKDLAKGGHTNPASVDIGIGDVSIEQKVGFLKFDLAQRMVGLYQNLDFCVPVFGCLTGVGQTIAVQLASSCPAHPVGRSCGTYPIKTAHALDVTASESSRYLGLQAPVITVVTPYGPVNVRPTIQFWSDLKAQLSPYGGSAFMDHTSGPLDYRFADPNNGFDDFSDLTDRYGRIPGVLFSSEVWGMSANVGWGSQVGLGSRDARPWTSAWSPGADPKPVRPDHDLGTARSNDEKAASVRVKAEAEISYAPTDILPSWLKGGAIDLWFKIWIKPKADAAVAGQLQLYASEATNYKVDNDLDTYTQLVVRDGATAAGSFVVDAGMDLVARIDLPSPLDDITLIDVHPDFSIPVTKGEDDSRTGGRWREARAGSNTAPPTAPAFDGPVTTFHGDVDGAAFVTQCLAEPIPEQAKPEPTFTPGDGNVLKKNLRYPCNICLGVGQHGIRACAPLPGHSTAECQPINQRCHPPLEEAGKCKSIVYQTTPQTAEIYPSTSNPLPLDKHWDCDSWGKAGCMDLCSFNPLTGALTVVASAEDVVGFHCGIPTPK